MLKINMMISIILVFGIFSSVRSDNGFLTGTGIYRGMTDPVIHGIGVGENIAATSAWTWAYVLPAILYTVIGFVLFLASHMIGRRISASLSETYAQKLVAYANLPACVILACSMFMFMLACVFVYVGFYGPANLISQHFDTEAPGMGDFTQWYPVNALPKYKTNQYAFYHWIYPMAVLAFTLMFVNPACSFFAREGYVTAAIVSFVGGVQAFLTLLAYLNNGTNAWYLLLFGCEIFALFNGVIIYLQREGQGYVLAGAVLFPFVYQTLFTITFSIAAYSSMLYTADVMFVWQVMFSSGFVIVFALYFIFLGPYVTPMKESTTTAVSAQETSGPAGIPVSQVSSKIFSN
jgi:hypothetical protein